MTIRLLYLILCQLLFVQNLRRGYDELAVAAPVNRRVAVAFDELAI
jgi:hypothetical protein